MTPQQFETLQNVVVHAVADSGNTRPTATRTWMWVRPQRE